MCNVSLQMEGLVKIRSAIRYSPAAQIPADHNNNKDVMQKKLIDCPISSQEPVSRTLKKKARVIPTPMSSM